MIDICPTHIDPYPILSAFESNLQPGCFGAAAHFVGSMRDFNEDHRVQSMLLEQYAPMTENALHALRQNLIDDYELVDALIVHRVGQIEIGEAIVVIGCWAAHRKAAFEACRQGMERLKTDVPLWKKETLHDGSTRWVEKNSKGY